MGRAWIKRQIRTGDIFVTRSRNRTKWPFNHLLVKNSTLYLSISRSSRSWMRSKLAIPKALTEWRSWIFLVATKFYGPFVLRALSF